MAALRYSGVLLQNCSNCLQSTLLQRFSNIQKSLFQFTITREKRKKKESRIRMRDLVKYTEQYISPSNKAFIQELVEDQYNSPLKEPPLEKKEWTPKSQRTGVIARKIGIIPQWTVKGRKFLSTLLQVQDNHVIKYIPSEHYRQSKYAKPTKKRLGALIVGTHTTDPSLCTGNYLSLFKEAGVMPKLKLTRFLITDDAYIQPGTPLYATHFRAGDYVDCQGLTIDHGFQGVVKRWGMKGGPATHGCTKSHRRLGAIGGGGKKAGVWRGKKMPGQMGKKRRIQRGLRIWRINTKYNVLYIHGHAVPGPINGYVYIFDTFLHPKRFKDTPPPPFPTYYPEDSNPLPEELFHPDLFQFNQPSIEYPEDPKEATRDKSRAKTAKIKRKT